jgi:organic hydroperoxide reductase OsmC/OhrA
MLLDTAGRLIVEAYTDRPLSVDQVHAVMLRAETAFRSRGELEAALTILERPRPDVAQARAHIRCYVSNLTQSSHGVTVPVRTTLDGPGGEG